MEITVGLSHTHLRRCYREVRGCSVHYPCGGLPIGLRTASEAGTGSSVSSRPGGGGPAGAGAETHPASRVSKLWAPGTPQVSPILLLGDGPSSPTAWAPTDGVWATTWACMVGPGPSQVEPAGPAHPAGFTDRSRAGRAGSRLWATGRQELAGGITTRCRSARPAPGRSALCRSVAEAPSPQKQADGREEKPQGSCAGSPQAHLPARMGFPATPPWQRLLIFLTPSPQGPQEGLS